MIKIELSRSLATTFANFTNMEYFKKLQDLLRIERQEDRDSYKRLLEHSTLQERRVNGITWYPVAIRGSELSKADYLTVELERTTHTDLAHQFRVGTSAVLFSNHDASVDRIEGTVTHQSNNLVKLSLKTDELPEWSKDGKLGLDLLFDEYSYDEMQNALRLASTMREKKEGHVVKVLVGDTEPVFYSPSGEINTNGLNPSQQAAVRKIIAANDLAIVHGPPGTGKTTTIVRAIREIIKLNKFQVLVVAPSNAAVDLLTEKLSDEGLTVVRIGNPARVSEKLMSLALDYQVAEHQSMKEIRRLRRQASEYRDMAHKYKRNFGKAERDQRKALFTEARNIMKEVENTEQYIIDSILSKADVVTATLVGANHFSIRNMRFKLAVIDEAGQGIEPACWIPVLKAEKVVLAGDHFQLPPTIKSEEAARNGLQKTLLEKCVELHPEAVSLLEEQYRMHQTIMGFSSRVFYESKLKAHSTVAAHLLYESDSPLAFIDTAGCGFDEKPEGTSTVNPEEASFLFRHLLQVVEQLSNYYTPEDFPTIAVISPYREQVYLMQELFLNSPVLRDYGEKISVNTIDSFQVQERDIVYISMTRSNPENRIGFLADIRRMNVAMTRARKKLVVVGDSATLTQLPFYADFISYAEEHNAYQSAWEFMDVG